MERVDEQNEDETDSVGYVTMLSCLLVLPLSASFWDWMYPVHGGGETTSEAALGVLILWFCWCIEN